MTAPKTEKAQVLPHCETCRCGRRAPVQSAPQHGRGPGTIAWVEHEQAHAAYAARHPGQDADTIARRGGFGYGELLTFLGHEPTTWRTR